MHIQLTDVLACPRCGPEFGLVLLADRIEERRVLGGALGCANCRERYPIVDGLADLRPPSAPALPGPDAAPDRTAGDESGAALRLAALLGVGDGRGFRAVVGDGARLASGIATLADGLEIVAVHDALAGSAEEPGVSRIAAALRLPLRDETFRAIALTGGSSAAIEEAARVLTPLGRLVLDPAPDDAAPRLAAAGLDIEARDGRTVLATRRAPVWPRARGS